jgi:hypothetical protein
MNISPQRLRVHRDDIFFRLPGDTGKRKPSALSGEGDLLYLIMTCVMPQHLPRRAFSFCPSASPDGQKKIKNLCDLCGSVVNINYCLSISHYLRQKMASTEDEVFRMRL